MKKIKLAVIFGGKSSEYPVSLHSTGSVLTQLHNDRYDVIMIGIDKSGTWFHYQGDITQIENDTWTSHEKNEQVVLSCSTAFHGFLVLKEDATFEQLQVDCIFPILHGKNGEDGTSQGLFELSGIPYVGCGHMSSSICMDKEMTHIICEHAQVPCAPYMSVYEDADLDYEAVYKVAEAKLSVPFFIKPCNAGSSFGVHKAHNYEEFKTYLKDAFFHDGKGKIIIEATIEGFEIGCAVMGNKDVFVGSVDEIETTQEFFDYEGKYEMVGSTIYCPARISDRLTQKAKDMAVQAYKAMNCTGMTRVDMFVTPQDTIVFNELNTIPGFTATSRYPSMMKEVGLSFPDLIDQLIELALEK